MATISDVAKKAGVSIATVSYVLNGKTDLVREETAERILRVAEELNYHASPLARGLATGSSYTVAVLLPDHAVFTHPIGSQEFLGVADEFYLSNYSMLIKPSYRDQSARRSDSGIPSYVEGILVLGPLSLDNPDLADARALNKPTVVLEDIPDDWGLTRVNADNYSAARIVLEHLLEQGHRSIGVVSQTSVSACMDRRIEGCRDALNDAGLKPDPSLFADVLTEDEAEVGRAVEAILDSPAAPTAIVALNSALMPAVAAAIDSRGWEVPGRIAVGCVDYGMPPNFRVEWPVVTLQLDLRRQGALAAQTLIEMLKSRTTAESRYLTPELTIFQP